MADRIILCSGCGTKNRVQGSCKGVPKCGKCGKQLYTSASTGIHISGKTIVGAVAVVGLVVFLASQSIDSGIESSSLSQTAETSSGSTQTAEPVFSAPPVSIVPGVKSGPRSQGLAPLGIKTSPGYGYFIKLVNQYGQTEMTIFVWGGQYFETLVPLGRYEMKYASGKTWYGAQHLFGPDTAYSKAETLFYFTQTAHGYNGYTVELIRQAGGNLPTKNINPSAF